MADRAGGLGGADTSIYRVPEQNMLGVAGQAMGLSNQAQDLQAKQFGLQVQRLQQLNAHLGSLIADPEVQAGGPGAMKKITQVGGQLVSLGIIPAKDLTVAIGGINPANPMAALRQAQLNTLSAQERMNAVYGTPTVVNNGQSQQFVRQSPFMGGVAPMAGGNIPNQISPEGRMQRVTGPVGPNGEATQESALAAGVREGTLTPQGNLVVPGAPPVPPNRLQQRTQPPQIPAGGLPVQAAPAPVGTALPPPMQPPRGVQAPAPAGPQVAQNNPFRSTTTSLPAGVSGAMGVDAEAGAQQGVALQRAADTLPDQRAELANLEKNLKLFESGPQAERLRQFKTGANAAGSLIGMTPFDKQSIASQEAFVKGAAILAQKQFGALGGTGTDQQLGSAIKANPNEALSKEGNKNLVAMLKGNVAALEAKNNAWQQWKAKYGPNSFSQFSVDFNQNFSPRAFQWAFMDAGERKKMFDSMTPAERKELGGALTTAEQRGWIRPDGQKNTARAQ